MRKTQLVHATAVAIDGEAVLLRGPPGAGKSDLALRLIDGGAALVSDDQTVLRRVGGRLVASAPEAIAGLCEIRGIGILRIGSVSEAPVALIADLVLPDQIARLPEQRTETILGVSVPAISVAPFEASAAAKLRVLRRALATGLLTAINSP